jgi:hypothetical protein
MIQGTLQDNIAKCSGRWKYTHKKATGIFGLIGCTNSIKEWEPRDKN